jgi:hypothetical protein
MANAKTANNKPARKEALPAFKRITDALKRETLRGKLTVEELTKISKLAESLQNFVV